MSAERERVAGFGKLEDGLRQAGDWYRWGPYVSERQWGTVREDYSADGEAWNYLPHDQARSRAYRWGEDGLAGFCDVEQRLCLGLALWNGRDPILKERPFGLTGAQGNHGEDVKEYWWYLDAIPSHAWNRWRYHYPQAAFPYAGPDRRERGARTGCEPEYELIDTGAFDDDRYWIVEVHYAKAESRRPADGDPGDQRRARTPTTLHVLPTAWFRNTWSWDDDAPKPARRQPTRAATGRRGRSASSTRSSANSSCWPAPDPTATVPTAAVLRERDQRRSACSAREPITPYPKDGINDHVINGAATVNPGRTGTKCAFWYQVTVAAAARRPSCGCGCAPAKASRAGQRRPLGAQFDQVIAQRRAEADEFYAELTPAGGQRRRGDGHAPGVRRDAVEQAAVLLRRGPLAGRRPDPADAAGSSG